MKAHILFPLLIAGIGAVAMAAPDPGATPGIDRAPFINKQIKELIQKIDSDVADGGLTHTDADELKRQVAEVQRIEDSEPALTPKTRRDLREKLSAIDFDLARREKQAKAMASASPTP